MGGGEREGDRVRGGARGGRDRNAGSRLDFEVCGACVRVLSSCSGGWVVGVVRTVVIGGGGRVVGA
jgi:hypothetical protein